MPLRRKVQVFVYRHAPELQVLLLRRAEKSKGQWQPVTGNLDAHEELRACAVREVLEETSLQVEPQPLGVTFTFEKPAGPARGRYHETVFAAVAPKDDDAIELSDEHDAHEWVDAATARERLAFEEQRKALDTLVARYGRRTE